MTEKRKRTFELDLTSQNPIHVIPLAFDKKKCKFEDKVREEIKACEAARDEPPKDADGNIDKEKSAENIMQAEKHAFKTMESELDKVLKLEGEVSKIWVECCTKTERGAEVTQNEFEAVEECLSEGREDIKETIELFYDYMEEHNDEYWEATGQAKQKYTKASDELRSIENSVDVSDAG